MPDVTETVACPSKFLLADQFWDWFCTDQSLPRRAEALQKKLAQIQHSPKFSRELRVSFKNNQPACMNTTYDDFRLVDPVSGDVVFCVVPHEPRSRKAEVWGRDADGKFDQLVEGSWRDVVRFFMPPIEAYGVRGMKSKPFRKVFASQAAFARWREAEEGNVEVHGVRNLDG